MTRRYYSPSLPAAGGLVELMDQEAQHASRVMRAQVGDGVILFDGQGHEAEATIQAIDKRTCVCQCDPPAAVDRELAGPLHLAVALPKPDRAKEMVERLCELGVRSLTPLVCERTQRPPTDALLEKLRRIVVESCKQSGRNVLMEIRPVRDFQAYVDQPFEGRQWMAHPSGGSGPIAEDFAHGTPVAAMVGPEGGFSDEEVARAEAAAIEKISLGPRIYRIETAATVLAVWLAGHREAENA
ncbi:16S rRNA (uracil(1498)-N(3))-methyltransferase [Roseiconus nitratireducens]|uniref:Ribosomal RNA small subunit methyltransferase E n=1 Tax=Roseiconus nitratireducens TaxID=2605748 RepID=A0A5M6DBG0_9BACT|nr:RsmE family RNA methyltransferase [Roseiconus nitratireducens]KAA5543652.1 16S rRNA (uracil(1498)-N(3))-methyltransferase [Roseiconus nitratireducens]